MKKTVLALVAILLPALAQGPPASRFSASTGNVSLSGAGTALTIQQPALSGTPSALALESAVVYCSVACVVTTSQNGTPATATAGTAVAITPVGQPSAATVWTGSNVGAGTAVPPLINVAAGTTVVIGLDKVVIPRAGPGANFTVSVGSITGICNISILWNEQRQ